MERLDTFGNSGVQTSIPRFVNLHIISPQSGHGSTTKRVSPFLQ